jgi:hypothetical protein
MTEPRPPFYVSFSHDRIPQTFDHSRSNPGPPGGSANRAGHTSARPAGRISFAWDQGPGGADRRFPIFARSINVFFWLKDFAVAISSDFEEQSCAYRTTLRHELQAHIYEPIRIFHSYREVVIRKLNTVVVPTEAAPWRVASEAEAATRQQNVEDQVVAVIRVIRGALDSDLKAARLRADDADHYRLVYRQCTDEEWASGR